MDKIVFPDSKRMVTSVCSDDCQFGFVKQTNKMATSVVGRAKSAITITMFWMNSLVRNVRLVTGLMTISVVTS